MKKTLLLTLLGVVALCAPAHAQVTYDMSKVTCADYNAMDPAAAQSAAAWMSGWFNQRSDNTVINLEAHRKNVATIKDWCSWNKSGNVMGRIEGAIQDGRAAKGGPTDINAAQITCGEYLGASPDEQLLISSWMGGWFMSSKNLTNVDERYARRNLEKVVEHCKAHKSRNLMETVKENWR